MTRRKGETHSPNRRRTLRKTLSFSGSYGWSLLGISKTVGKAAVYVSTRYRILSAIYRHSVSDIQDPLRASNLTCWLIKTMPMSFRSVVNFSKQASIVALSVLLSTTRKFF